MTHPPQAQPDGTQGSGEPRVASSGVPGPPRLLGPREVRALAAELELRPTKARGQNFVIDPNTVRRIVALAGVTKQDHVLEVGPGLGSLTLGLLGVVAGVTALEIDPALADRLPATASEFAPGLADRLTVINADALDAGELSLPVAPTAIVANLPYNVAVPVLISALIALPSLRSGLVMVQKEVADRLCAGPGSRVYGAPSVKVAWFMTASAAGTVPPSVFWPAPRVDSGLVRLTRASDANADADADVDAVGGQAPESPSITPKQAHTATPTRPLAPEQVRRTAFAAIDAAFGHRRKVLRTVLAPWAGSLAAAEDILHACGIDPRARGETLAVADFRALALAKLALSGDQ